jgi:hypothetical protein
MDTTQGFLLAASWFLLRFGLPILFTLILIIIFSKIDSRWRDQALANKKVMFQDQVIPMIKCWVFNDCPPEKREKCPAYQEKNIPCWQGFRDQYGTLRDGCLGCEVFKQGPLPFVKN